MDKPSNITRKSISCLILTVVFVAVPMVTIAELYKYKNEDGVTVLDSHVPARYVKYGYTILSLNGRVLEVVPRALTDAEIRARDNAIAEQQRLDRKRREQKIADQNLLRLYSTPEDVIRARDTKLRSIESFINAQTSNARRLQEQKRQLESSLADIERSGGTIGKDRIDRIRSIEGRMSQIQNEIQAKHDEMEVLRTTYAADLTRVRRLYGNDPGR